MDFSLVSAVLAQAPLDVLELAWQPIIARDRRAVGIRLALAADDEARVAALTGGLIEASAELGGLPQGLVVLAPRGRSDAALPGLRAPRNVLLELPAPFDDEALAALIELQRHGVRLVARAENCLPLAQQPVFSYVVRPAARLAEERRTTDASLWASSARTLSEVEAAFEGGASAVIGWPLESGQVRREGLHPEQRVVLELIRLVQRDADVGELEAAFKQEPVLAYMLLTLVNSPAFARSAPLASSANAIQMLGYRRIVRWLVLLLVVAGKDSQALPLVHQTVARGMFLENLGGAARRPALECDELFIVGAFSLLDLITGQDFDQLLAESLLPPAVVAAIRERAGDYGRMLALAEALEGPVVQEIAPLVQSLGLSREAVNRALLSALLATDALQGAF